MISTKSIKQEEEKQRDKFLKRGDILAREVVKKKKDRKFSIKMVTTRA